MDIGIYNAKYPLRKLLNFMMPWFKNTNPNCVSLMLIPLGILTALVTYFAVDWPWLYWLTAIFIVLRMIIGTLDGQIAVTFAKQSDKGEMINRLAPELADILLMIAIVLSYPAHITLGVLALAVSWGISYLGLIGLVGHKTTQSVGPVGQTDRIAILIVFAILQFFSMQHQWPVNFMLIFLVWVILGGIITMAIRCYRILK